MHVDGGLDGPSRRRRNRRHQQREQDRVAEAMSELEAHVDQLDAWWQQHRAGRAVVTLDGMREGDYRLDWQVRDTAFGKPLLMSEQTLRLTAGTHAMEFALPAQRVVDGYRALLSRQDANVMVDEPFVFEAELAPIPTAHETSRMPANEVHNLANGWSSLIQRSRAEFAVRFFLYGDRLSWE